MTKHLLVWVLIGLQFSAKGQEQSILGLWKGEDKQEIKIQIYYAKDGAYYGKTSDGKEKIVLKRMIYDTLKKHYKGTMHPPDANIELNATLIQIGPNKLKITVRKLLLTKTMYISRIQ